MRKARVAVLVSILFFAVFAHANGVPTFAITLGSATVDINPFTFNPEVFFQFSGNGFSITGSGGISSNFSILGAPPGYGLLDPGLSIFSPGSDGGGAAGTIGGVNYCSLGFTSFFFTSGPNFNLPS